MICFLIVSRFWTKKKKEIFSKQFDFRRFKIFLNKIDLKSWNRLYYDFLRLPISHIFFFCIPNDENRSKVKFREILI